jgi:hypothetical protein
MNQRTAHLWRALLAMTALTDGTAGFFPSSAMPRPAVAASAVGRGSERASEGQGVSSFQVEAAAVPKQANHLFNRLGNPRFVAAPMVR